MILISKKLLSFDDVILTPQHSDIESRKNVDLSVEFLGMKFKIPIIAANMSSVCETKMCIAMGDLGGLGILHRFCPVQEQEKMAADIFSGFWDPESKFGFSIGIGDDWKERMERCSPYANLACLDIAHADCKRVNEFIKIYSKHYCDIPLIIGQISTKNAILKFQKLLKEFPIKNVAFKGSIGSGSHCTTRIQTGHGIPTFQFLKDVSDLNFSDNIQIVADGGIRNSGDIVKCLAAGAKMVMLGNLFSGTDEAPGEIINIQGGKHKEYKGSASKSQKSLTSEEEIRNIEGVSSLVPYKGPVENIISDLCDGIKSGCSYSGAQNLKELYENAEFAEMTYAGFIEGGPHGLK